MKDESAAGPKTETDTANDLKLSLARVLAGLRSALARSEERSSDNHDKYDGYGRLRDRELASATRLGAVSAQMAVALVRVHAEFGDDTRAK